MSRIISNMNPKNCALGTSDVGAVAPESVPGSCVDLGGVLSRLLREEVEKVDHEPDCECECSAALRRVGLEGAEPSPGVMGV